MADRKDLTTSNKDYSVFLPSISSFYSKFIAQAQLRPDFVKPERMPAGFEYGIDGFDFLKPKDNYYNYNGVFTLPDMLLEILQRVMYRNQ